MKVKEVMHRHMAGFPEEVGHASIDPYDKIATRTRRKGSQWINRNMSHLSPAAFVCAAALIGAIPDAPEFYR
jgi:hypothetical protein